MSHATHGPGQGLSRGDTRFDGAARGGSGTGGTARKPGHLSRLEWKAAAEGETGGIDVPELAAFVGAKRTQLAVLSKSAVTGALRKGLEAVTRVASMRPQTLGRTQVLARLRALSRPAVAWEELRGEPRLSRGPVRGNRVPTG